MLNTIRPFVGFFIAIIGIVIFIFPVPLGMPIILIGLTMLTPEFKVFRHFIQRVEGLNPKYGRKLKFMRMKLLRFMGYRGSSF